MLITFLLGILVTALAAGFLLARARRGNERLRREIVQLNTSTAGSEDPVKPAMPHRIDPEERLRTTHSVPPGGGGTQPPPHPGAHGLPGTNGEGVFGQPGRPMAADGNSAEEHSVGNRVPAEHRRNGDHRGYVPESSSVPATTGQEQQTQPVAVDAPHPAGVGTAGNGSAHTGNGSTHAGNGSTHAGNGSTHTGNGSTHTGDDHRHPGDGSQQPNPHQTAAWPQQSGRLPQQTGATDRSGQSDQDRSEHDLSSQTADGAAARPQGDDEPMEVARRRIAELRTRLGEVTPGRAPRQPEQ